MTSTAPGASKDDLVKSGSPTLPIPKPIVKRKPRRDKDGNKLKRHGKVIDAFRAESTGDVERQVEVYDPAGRTSSRLMGETLAVALCHHLIHMSDGVVSVANSRPALNIGRLHRDYLRKGWRLRDQDPKREVILAALLGLGARRSNHSAITGDCPSERRIKHGDSRAVSLALGERREAKCRTLAERMVSLAKECDLLADPSREAKEIASLLRIVLFALQPTHPYLSDLSLHLHENHNDKRFTKDYFDLSPVEFDACVALLLRRPPIILDSELLPIYGYHQDQIPDAVHFLKEEIRTGGLKGLLPSRITAPGNKIAFGILRGLNELQQLESNLGLKGLPVVCSLLERIFMAVDIAEEMVVTVDKRRFGNPAYDSVDLRRTLNIAPHIGVAPMFAEAIIANEVQRVLGHLAQEELKVRELIELTVKRFLLWLKKFCVYINDPQFDSKPSSLHNRGLLISTLSLFPSWIDVCSEAAEQSRIGKGIYASIQFSWDHLRSLRAPLVDASTVFGRSGRQLQKLERAFLKFGPPWTVETGTLESLLNVCILEEELAREIVTTVLDGLEGE